MSTTLKNVSSKARGDLKREESRDFSAEEMKSPDVQRALRHGILVEVPKESARSSKREPSTQS